MFIKKNNREFKTKVTLTKIREGASLAQQSSYGGVNASIISKRKKQAIWRPTNIFFGCFYFVDNS